MALGFKLSFCKLLCKLAALIIIKSRAFQKNLNFLQNTLGDMTHLSAEQLNSAAQKNLLKLCCKSSHKYPPWSFKGSAPAWSAIFQITEENQTYLSKGQRRLVLPCWLLLPGQEGGGWEEGDRRGSALLSYEAAAPFGPGPGL